MDSTPTRRDTAGATRILIRNTEAVSNRGPQLDQNQERLAKEPEIRPDESEVSAAGLLEHADGGRAELERRLSLALEERAQLQEQWSLAEKRSIQQSEELRAERERWNLWRTEVKARIEAVEVSGSAIERTLLLEHGKLEEKHAAEILQLESAKLALAQEKRQAEEEGARLRQALAAAEARMENQAEQLRAEREQWKSTRETLEQGMAAKLDEAGDGPAIAQREHPAQDTSREELERRLSLALKEQTRLESQWSQAEEQIARQAKDFCAERERWNLWRAALKTRLEAVEASSSALEQAVLEKHTAEIFPSDTARLELEAGKRQAEEESARLREALAAAETRVKDQAEQLRAERERWELACKTLEEQHNSLEARFIKLEEARNGLAIEHREQLAQAEESRRQLEQRAAALSDELRQAMDKYNQAIEEFRSERAQWESAKNELDNRNASLDEKFRLAERGHQELLEEREDYRLKWESTRVELCQLQSNVQSISALACESAETHQQLLNKLRELSRSSEQTSPQ